MDQKNRPTHRSEAAVLRLSDFRGTENHSRDTHGDATIARAEAVRRHIRQTLLDSTSPTVAAATVYIDARGHVGISAAGIEPEMAVAIADELRQLAITIEQHQNRERRRRPSRRREGGYTNLAALAGIAFIVATYVNPFDWLDAALSLGAQVSAIFLSRNPDRLTPSLRTTKDTSG